MSGDIYVVVVLGAMFALATLVPAMVPWLRPLYSAILPELGLFDSYRDRTRALSSARTSVHGDAWIGLLFGAMLLGLWMFTRRIPWWGSDSLLFFMTLFVLSPYLVAHVVFYSLFQQRLRRSLRHQLAERGHTICVQCGYDLRGQSEARCPECGERVHENRGGRGLPAAGQRSE